MKKILIIVNGYFENPNNTYKSRRLMEEFNLRGYAVDIISALDLLPLCNGEKIEIKNIQEYSLAIDLDKDSYLADCLEALNLPLCNSAKSLHLSDDKMSSIIALSHHGIKSPLTIPAPLCYAQNVDELKRNHFLNQVERSLGYPLVYKSNHGSMGKQVLLIKNREELETIEKTNCSIPHLYEKFLRKHAGHDYRIMVIGDEVVACMERVNDKDFRSNIALGGKGYDVTETLGEDYRQLAIKACKILSLDYAGIDVATSDEGEPVFIEANGNAFFTEIEMVTKIDITKKLVDYLIQKYSI